MNKQSDIGLLYFIDIDSIKKIKINWETILVLCAVKIGKYYQGINKINKKHVYAGHKNIIFIRYIIKLAILTSLARRTNKIYKG